MSDRTLLLFILLAWIAAGLIGWGAAKFLKHGDEVQTTGAP